MLISIKVTKQEMEQMGFDKAGLIEHVIDTLDRDDKELVGYNVEVTITDKVVRSELSNKVLDFMRKHSMKIGHAIPMKLLQSTFLQSLTPKEQDELQGVLDGLVTEGIITESGALTQTGFETLY